MDGDRVMATQAEVERQKLFYLTKHSLIRNRLQRYANRTSAYMNAALLGLSVFQPGRWIDEDYGDTSTVLK